MILLSNFFLFVILFKLLSIPSSQFLEHYALKPLILSLKVASILFSSFLKSSLQSGLTCKHALCNQQYLLVFLLGCGLVRSVFFYFVAFFVLSSLASSCSIFRHASVSLFASYVAEFTLFSFVFCYF